MNTLRIRTLTAGVSLSNARDLAKVEAALNFLSGAKRVFEQAGYEVQTARVALTPIIAGLSARERERALGDLAALDRLVGHGGAIVSIGPVQRDNHPDDSLPAWADELARTTRTISFSIAVASGGRVHDHDARNAAQVMIALSRALPDGMANFRFAAAAHVPAGAPFFPAAWHDGPDAFSIGVEAAGVVAEAFASAHGATDARERLTALLDERFRPIETLAMEVTERSGRAYLGIDASPAPGLDRSIAAAIEALTKTPFGAPGTLEACAVVTGAIKALRVKTCGYSGLMLPVLEDPVLARRAGEGRFGVRDLLLYSSVCGAGLDVVPIPGDTPVDVLASLLRDLATLSSRLAKPLSARMFVLPGRKAGEIARFSDPWLTDSIVLPVE